MPNGPIFLNVGDPIKEQQPLHTLVDFEIPLYMQTKSLQNNKLEYS